MLQFRDFPAWIDVLITQAPERTLERGCHPRYYGIWGRPGLQHLQNGLIAEARTGPRPQLPNVGRNREKTTGPYFDATGPRAGIAASKFGIPQACGVRFPAQQRVVRTLAPVARMVANRRSFRMSKDGDHRAIQIENQP